MSSSNVERGWPSRIFDPDEPWLREHAAGVPRVAFSPGQAPDVPKSRIWLAIELGQLPAHKAGKNTLIEAGELVRWVRSLPTREPDPAKGAETTT